MRLVVTGCVLTVAALGVACGGRPLESPISPTAIAGYAGPAFAEGPTRRDVSYPRADVDLTGVWAINGQPAIVLQQNGGNVTGVPIVPPLPVGASLIANSVTGTIVGNAVNLTGVFGIRIVTDLTLTVTSNSQFTLQLVDSSTMTGTSTTTTVSECAGNPLCLPPTTQSETWSGTLTRVTATTPPPESVPPIPLPCAPFPECLATQPIPIADPGSTFGVSPFSESIGVVSLCSGGQISGTAHVTGLDGLTWTAELGWSVDPSTGLTASIDRTSGTGGGTVTITIVGRTVPLTSCTHFRRDGYNSVKFKASNGEEANYVVFFGIMYQGG